MEEEVLVEEVLVIRGMEEVEQMVVYLHAPKNCNFELIEAVLGFQL